MNAVPRWETEGTGARLITEQSNLLGCPCTGQRQCHPRLARRKVNYGFHDYFDL